MVWKQTTGVSGNIVWGDLEFAESGRMRSTWQMDRLEHLRRFVADGYYKLHHIQNINVYIFDSEAILSVDNLFQIRLILFCTLK